QAHKNKQNYPEHQCVGGPHQWRKRLKLLENQVVLGFQYILVNFQVKKIQGYGHHVSKKRRLYGHGVALNKVVNDKQKATHNHCCQWKYPKEKELEFFRELLPHYSITLGTRK